MQIIDFIHPMQSIYWKKTQVGKNLNDILWTCWVRIKIKAFTIVSYMLLMLANVFKGGENGEGHLPPLGFEKIL